MLERLVITDFAVARSITLEPGPGLNVFTGETGAGKSLVVDALAFLFGGRRGREVIAAGAERASVEARVRDPEGQPLVIERTVGLSGRSSARADGAAASVEDLRGLGARLVDIHGQSEQLAILRAGAQLAVLDEFAGLGAMRGEVTELVRELRRVRREIAALATDARERERLLQQLQFEVEEIAAAALAPGEDAGLREEMLRLSSTGRRRADAGAAIEALDTAPIDAAVRATRDLLARDPAAAELSDLAVLFESTAGELARGLRRYQEAIDEDPARLAAVGERLDHLARLRRKYGETLDEVIAYGREAGTRLDALTTAGESSEALAARQAELLGALGALAEQLSQRRRAAAGDLVRAIAAELSGLGMERASLSIGFSCDDDSTGPCLSLPDYEVVIAAPLPACDDPLPRAFSETGVDRVEFLASFNAGETPRSLAAVASGGETSRFLLALTTVLGQAAQARLIVLDEVDEGVGGRAGALVGAALARLARRHQVLCVTHLPQVAAFGRRHFVVSKRTDGARTWSEVAEVTGAARVAELAAMLGGTTEANRAAAAELLAGARP